jgi:predicted TIM-barrel fold metal-dependent hydrolase
VTGTSEVGNEGGEGPEPRRIPAPRRDSHPPTTFTPPPRACDAHCHVFGPAGRFPFSPTRTYTPPDSGYEQFIELQERLGLSRAVLVQASCHGTDNRAMVDALQQARGRFAGVAMIDESFGPDDLRRLHDAGVRGTRFNFVAHLGGAPDLEVFRRLVDRVAPLGWHIVLHFDARDLASHADLLGSLPTPYVIDHMARVDAAAGLDQEPFQELLGLLEGDERAWVKISGAERLTAAGPPPYDDVVPYARALIEAAPDRVLWGTDWPHPNVRHMPDDADLVDLLTAFAPDEATRNRILVDNPERLYDFDD